jgi:hypothetical protein
MTKKFPKNVKIVTESFVVVEKEVGKSEPLVSRIVDPVETVLTNVELDPFSS